MKRKVKLWLTFVLTVVMLVGVMPVYSVNAGTVSLNKKNVVL